MVITFVSHVVITFTPPPYRGVGVLAELEGEGGHLFEAFGLEFFEGVLGEAALAPGGEVGFGDGFGVEVGCDDMLDFGE